MIVKIKPASPELKIRDPKTKEIIPVEGKLVEMNSFWHRRIKDGDMVIVVADKPEVIAPVKKV